MSLSNFWSIDRLWLFFFKDVFVKIRYLRMYFAQSYLGNVNLSLNHYNSSTYLHVWIQMEVIHILSLGDRSDSKYKICLIIQCKYKVHLKWQYIWSIIMIIIYARLCAIVKPMTFLYDWHTWIGLVDKAC